MDEPDPHSSAAGNPVDPGAPSNLRLIGWSSAGLGVLWAVALCADVPRVHMQMRLFGAVVAVLLIGGVWALHTLWHEGSLPSRLLRAAMTTVCTCFVAMFLSALLCAVFGGPDPHPDEHRRRGTRLHYELDLRDLDR